MMTCNGHATAALINTPWDYNTHGYMNRMMTATDHGKVDAAITLMRSRAETRPTILDFLLACNLVDAAKIYCQKRQIDWDDIAMGSAAALVAQKRSNVKLAYLQNWEGIK